MSIDLTNDNKTFNKLDKVYSQNRQFFIVINRVNFKRLFWQNSPKKCIKNNFVAHCILLFFFDFLSSSFIMT